MKENQEWQREALSSFTTRSVLIVSLKFAYPACKIQKATRFQILIEYINSAFFIFVLRRVVIWEHRSSNDNILTAIAINIGHGQRVSKIGADLFASNIFHVGQVPRQYLNLLTWRNSLKTKDQRGSINHRIFRGSCLFLKIQHSAPSAKNFWEYLI